MQCDGTVWVARQGKIVKRMEARMARIYVAATEQHAGKTTVSVGLYRAAIAHGYKACFIKPVGQRYVLDGGQRVDEDAVLFKRALGVPGTV